MNNRNSMLALLAGILCGGLAFFFLHQKASEIEKKATPTEVLVAARYVPAGQFLRMDMVAKQRIPESFVSPSAIREINEVEGLLSLVPISAGEQILSNKFGAAEESLSLALIPGFRAYTLEVSETSGVGNLLRPGNRVDILTKVGTEKREMVSFAFQNLSVLAVGQKLGVTAGRKASPDSSLSETREDTAPYSTVTLAVTPEEAETLFYLDGRSLRLVLRPPGDDEIVSIPTRSDTEILARLGRFSRPATRNIEVIRGNSKQGE